MQKVFLGSVLILLGAIGFYACRLRVEKLKAAINEKIGPPDVGPKLMAWDAAKKKRSELKLIGAICLLAAVLGMALLWRLAMP